MEPQLKFERMPVVCFAPPLSDERLAEYEGMVEALSSADLSDLPDTVASRDGTFSFKPEEYDSLRKEWVDAFNKLLLCVKTWWELPESKVDPTHPRLAIKHRGKDITIPLTPLEKQHIESLDEVTPFLRELTHLSNEQGDGLFDLLPQGGLRDAAFHLLWYVKEIANDREPLSQDKLPT